jgi:ribosomal protein S18 acetylase RimI-like enzyme
VDPEVRRAVPADARAIAEVHVAGWRDAYRSHMSEEYLATLSVADREAMWARALARDDRSLWVAERNGRIVGFVEGRRSSDPDTEASTGQVSAIYVEPSEIGRGLGRALFARAVGDLGRLGYRRATLWVLASNDRARRFYEAAGWHADGAVQTEDFGGARLEEVRYVVDLAPPSVSDPPPSS